MLLIHAIWSDGALHLWGEDAAKCRAGEPALVGAAVGAGNGDSVNDAHHPFSADTDAIHGLIGHGSTSAVTLRLPTVDDHPMASPGMAHATGRGVADADGAVVLSSFTVPSVRVEAHEAAHVLEALDQHGGGSDGSGGYGVGPTVPFFAAASRFVLHLLAQQRFVPMLRQDADGRLSGVWMPWYADGPTQERLTQLVSAMPPVARAAVDSFQHEGWPMLEDFLTTVGDAHCRRVMLSEDMEEAIEDRDASDQHVMWLQGLLKEEDGIESSFSSRSELVKHARRWVGSLEDRGESGTWRLCLRLGEPVGGTILPDLVAPDNTVVWPLSLHLQSIERPSVVIDATDIWALRSGALTMEGERIDAPQEHLLGELGRAARLYKPIERLLEQAEPTEIELTTAEAYRFLREVRPILLEQGFAVESPEWWDSPTVRLGARMKIESDPIDFDFDHFADSPGTAGGGTQVGMNSLVSYNWQLAVGETLLTMEQFERLAESRAPLVMLDGRWVEIRQEDIKAAIEFMKENPGGEMEIGRALRLAYASDSKETGIQITGMDATGWVDAVFGDSAANMKLPALTAPEHFVGTLRPYQVKGLSWLAFLDRFGIGACLADDMGLGKTVQLLALLLHEKDAQREGRMEQSTGPTLLVVPMSVVQNWVNEAKRFSPDIKVLVHHGIERYQGEAFRAAIEGVDVVITTYALAHRDRETLECVQWRRMVLDEAQNIKNPGAKQTRAIRTIDAPRRVALTGTPVENRLGELWSIMEFLNPSFLGGAEDFRKRFAVPIERYHDKGRAEQLRGLVQPFVLRRLKSDPAVITDLPEKVESKEYCYLTPEQATLYEMCVRDMLSAADKTDGMQRRGIVLAGLIKLKQICNHPGHFLKEGERAEGPLEASRSGKCSRLLEMLDEVLAAQDQALVFTQFRQMGHLLSAMLRHRLDREVLFLHGGSSAKQRQQMIDQFQAADGQTPIFILSLKAGGVGLNLTAANHVFHFDRWWNPAVEAQATDRAYRIGQTRTVQVHKFIVSGTLEERIDEMIESKKELAEKVISSGERWLTDLSTSQLRDLLTLRADGVEASS